MLLHCSLPHSTAWAMFNDHMGAAGCCRSRKGDHPGGCWLGESLLVQALTGDVPTRIAAHLPVIPCSCFSHPGVFIRFVVAPGICLRSCLPGVTLSLSPGSLLHALSFQLPELLNRHGRQNVARPEHLTPKSLPL